MKNLFALTDRVFVITGATGVLAGSAADYLAAQGARIAFLGRSQEKLDAALAKCRAITPDAQCVGLVADVLDRPALEQARAGAVFTSLHQIPYGEVWPREAIRERKQMIEDAGLRWTAVESVPVHEDIKTGGGDLARLLENYNNTLRNLATEGIFTVIYNFMPVLDWVRTDMRWVLPDGSESMHYDPARFAAFEIHALKRPGAEADYSPQQLEQAAAWWSSLDDGAHDAFVRTIIDVFPGVKWALSLDDIRAMLAKYDGMGADGLRRNLASFLQEIIPVAEEVGVRMAIHPDDPPFSVLGLPQIVSTAGDIEAIFQMADNPANGLCFCTGSFSARADNDLPEMVKEFAPHIHATHLRSTQRLPDGSFYEANHLEGSVDMPAVVRNLLDEQDRRRAEGRGDWQLAQQILTPRQRPRHLADRLVRGERPGGERNFLSAPDLRRLQLCRRRHHKSRLPPPQRGFHQGLAGRFTRIADDDNPVANHQQFPAIVRFPELVVPPNSMGQEQSARHETIRLPSLATLTDTNRTGVVVGRVLESDFAVALVRCSDPQRADATDLVAWCWRKRGFQEPLQIFGKILPGSAVRFV